MGNLTKGFMYIVSSIILAMVVATISPIIYSSFGTTPALQPGEDAAFDATSGLINLELLGTWMPSIIIAGGIISGFVQIFRPDTREYYRGR